MDGGDRILVAAGLTAAVVVGAFVLWGPGGAPKVRKRRGQIAGLQNLGRTCFLNTLLQALAACPTFIEWLRKYAKGGGNNSMITTLYTVIDVVNGTHESARGTPVCPLGVLQSLRAAGWVIPEEQQDAHELLHVLLSCIEEETTALSKKPGCLSDALGLNSGCVSALASPSSPPSMRPQRADSTPPTPCNRIRNQDDEPELCEPEPPMSLPLSRWGSRSVSRSFCSLSGRRWLPPAAPRPPPAPPTRGTTASRLQCTHCSTKSPIRYDKFDSISLPLTNASIGITGTFTLAGLLRSFTAPEIVKGVKCEKCCKDSPTAPEGAKHIKTVNFGKLPSVLVLHVGRVQWNEGGLCKRGEFVSFPETLNLAPYVHYPQSQNNHLSFLSNMEGSTTGSAASAAPRVVYGVCACVVHIGGPRSGHFATYRRGNGRDLQRYTYTCLLFLQKWWYTSDTLVHEVSLDEVLRCNAYMLFYERVTGPSTGLPPLPPH